MRFYVDYDQGDLIRFWIVPDNPSATSRVNVTFEGRPVGAFDAWISDPAIRSNGWHSTGQCAFEFTEANLPGLATARRVEIHDADTNVLIYRRSPDPDLVRCKLVLLDTSVHGDSVLPTSLFHRFQQSYFGIGALPEEVLRVLCQSPWLTSAILSGSIPIAKYEGVLTGENVLTAALVHDPYVEMANRLLWLHSKAGAASDPLTAWRVGRHVEAAKAVGEHDLGDVRSLKRFFQVLPEDAYHFLYNPLTRQFSLSQLDERLMPGHSIVAIEIIARVGVVGHRDYYEAFVASLFHRLGIDAAIPQPEPIGQEALDLAKRLRAVKATREMLVFDVAMADAIRAAVSRGWSG